MIHARLEVAQVLDRFEVRAVIHEFSPGEDPTVWTSIPHSIPIPETWNDKDALSIILEAIKIWSESTIST